MTSLLDQAKALKNIFSVVKKKTGKQSLGIAEGLEIENSWGASYLFAEILANSETGDLFSIDRGKLNSIYKSFKSETGRELDVEELFQKNWLRNVYGKVEISGSIRLSMYSLKRIIELEKELVFLKKIKDAQQEEWISKAEFDEVKIKYEADNALELDIQKAIDAQWIKIEDEEIVINDLEKLIFLSKDINQFLFIKKLYDLDNARFDQLRIGKNALKNIWDKHQHCFRNTPSIEILIGKKALIEHSDFFVVNLPRSEFPYTSAVSNKTGALLWEKVINNDSFENDFERMKYWYDRIIETNEHEWCDINFFFQGESKKRFLKVAIQILLNDADLSAGQDELS
ncbi:MAG: hypothetical protein ABUT20_65340, partial [Bacteroidota bacterium]